MKKTIVCVLLAIILCLSLVIPALATESLPVKYSGNPVLVGGTWDADIYYNTVLTDESWPIESRFRIWYGAYSDDQRLLSCYAYSADGYSWVKPNLGLIDYDGSTTNNIILPIGFYLTSATYEDGMYYLVMSTRPETGQALAYAEIFSSPYPDHGFTLVKSLFPGCLDKLGMSLTKTYEGNWILYYQAWVDNKRQIAAFVSETSDISGNWSDIGIIVSATSGSFQRYAIGTSKLNSMYYHFIPIYDVETHLMDISLYTSANGLDIVLEDAHWIPLGSIDEWDDCMIIDGESLLEVGSELWYYYSGIANTHAVYPETRGGNIGLAKMPNPNYVPPEVPVETRSLVITIICNNNDIDIEIKYGGLVIFQTTLKGG